MFRRLRKLFRTVLLLQAVAVVGYLLWRWLTDLSKDKRAPVREGAPRAPGPPVVDLPEGAEPPVAAPADDLRRIEGIGPKISSVLNAAGIRSFEALSKTGAEQLKEILREGGIRIGLPGTWAEQARLAAAGEWEALAALQRELKGGRRVQ